MTLPVSEPIERSFSDLFAVSISTRPNALIPSSRFLMVFVGRLRCPARSVPEEQNSKASSCVYADGCWPMYCRCELPEQISTACPSWTRFLKKLTSSSYSFLKLFFTWLSWRGMNRTSTGALELDMAFFSHAFCLAPNIESSAPPSLLPENLHESVKNRWASP